LDGEYLKQIKLELEKLHKRKRARLVQS